MTEFDRSRRLLSIAVIEMHKEKRVEQASNETNINNSFKRKACIDRSAAPLSREHRRFSSINQNGKVEAKSLAKLESFPRAMSRPKSEPVLPGSAVDISTFREEFSRPLVPSQPILVNAIIISNMLNHAASACTQITQEIHVGGSGERAPLSALEVCNSKRHAINGDFENLIVFG